MTAPLFRRPAVFDALLASGLVLLATALLGQDANWDLQNYHLYTPMALLSGRWPQDIAVAQLQSWHNPTLDLPLGGLVLAGAPGWLVSLWLALPSAVALFFALRLMDRLWPQAASRWRSGVAALVALSGAAVLPGIAASFNDAFVAALAMPALWWMAGTRDRPDAWRGWWLPGLLLGLAAGLKLTAAIYCLGLLAACLFAGSLRRLPARVALLGIGGIGGFAAGAGWWMWRLWREHGNPLFPYFNQWFHSPDAPYLDHADARFKPETLADALLVPLRLLGENRRYAELTVADPRLLLGLLALLAWGIAWGRKKRSSVATPGPAPWPLLAFVAASYAAWLALYGIYRYLLPLEMLLSVVFVGMLSQLPLRRWLKPALALAAVLVAAATNHPNWGRQDFRSPMVDVRFPPFPRDSLVLLAGIDPLGHAVAFLPSDVAAVSLSNNFMDPQRCTRLQDRVESRIRSHRGPLYLMRQATPAAAPFQAYGLAISGSCVPVADSLVPVELCALRRAAPTTARSCSWTAAGR
ncbi:hypothetical protein GCM10027084_06720 [Pseudoxanthomonas sangjuensis]|uniref:glycosyltransferase 87 family protein n=1 Tax=Pseudoxanthomonas sangjuensis TaxID=1503750 RepID=UPI001391417E|nr:glycosyltransferase 87 family protein [Pseudoxanthomonas sangjuensis]KAF1714151.1 hypothetical protein CSC71_05415 [Pseudoxanthomonas sangjuensis]